MPYIAPEARNVYEAPLRELFHKWLAWGQEPGELAYILYRLAISALSRFPKTARYKDYALILGVLESVVEEFKGRLRYYESLKMEETGDIDPL